MLDAANDAIRFAEDHQRVLLECIEIIGEAASRVSAETQASVAELPWPDIIGMRHRLRASFKDRRVGPVGNGCRAPDRGLTFGARSVLPWAERPSFLVRSRAKAVGVEKLLMMCNRGLSIGWGPIVLAALACGSPSFAQGGAPAAVTVEAVRLDSVQEQRLFTGEFRAQRRSKVATQEPGLVRELPIVEGQQVKAGDVLARLDARRLEVSLRQIEADEQTIAALIEERSVTLDWRKRDLELYQSSYERGAANPKELFDAQSEVRIAEARLRESERQRDVIRVRAELLQERLEDQTIKAPFDGVVVIKHCELGEWVGEGDAVAELVSRGRIEAWLDIPQRFYDKIAGKSIEIAIGLSREREIVHRGEARVIPLMDPRARTFDLVAQMDDRAGMLTPGMSIRAWVPTGEVADRLTVHHDAVLRNDAGAYVFVARSAGPTTNAVPVPVVELFPWNERVVVRSDELKPGDQVIVEGNERLFPMAPVAPMEAPVNGAGGPS